jgi:hypothetical protein
LGHFGALLQFIKRMQNNPVPKPCQNSALANQTLSLVVVGSPLIALIIIYSIRLGLSGNLMAPSTNVVIQYSLPIIFALSVLIEGMGYSSTIFRGYLNKKNFTTHRAAFLITPLTIFALCLSSPTVAASIFFLNSLFFIFHASMQNYGIFRFYEREAGFGSRPIPYYSFFMGINLLVLFTGSTLINGRLGSTRQFFELEPGIPAAIFSFLSIYKEIGTFLGPILPVLFYASIAFLIFLPILLIKDMVSRKGALFMFLYFLYWPWAILCSNPIEGLFGHTIIHSVQTFGMSYRTERNQLREKGRGLTFGIPSEFLLVLFAFLLLVPGGTLNTVYERVSEESQLRDFFYSFPLVFLFALHQATRFTHFFTDGLIWRNPKGSTLKVTS